MLSSRLYFTGSQALISILAAVILTACAHTRPIANSDDLSVIRQECLEAGGIFHVRLRAEPNSWRADVAECWYGARIVDVERARALSDCWHGAE